MAIGPRASDFDVYAKDLEFNGLARLQGVRNCIDAIIEGRLKPTAAILLQLGALFARGASELNQAARELDQAEAAA